MSGSSAGSPTTAEGYLDCLNTSMCCGKGSDTDTPTRLQRAVCLTDHLRWSLQFISTNSPHWSGEQDKEQETRTKKRHVVYSSEMSNTCYIVDAEYYQVAKWDIARGPYGKTPSNLPYVLHQIPRSCSFRRKAKQVPGPGMYVWIRWTLPSSYAPFGSW